MVDTLIKRIERAEQVVGDDGACPRCSGTMIVRSFGGIVVVKDRTPLGPEAAHRFVAEAEANGGRCPECGEPWINVPVQIRPGSTFYK